MPIDRLTECPTMMMMMMLLTMMMMMIDFISVHHLWRPEELRHAGDWQFLVAEADKANSRKFYDF